MAYEIVTAAITSGNIVLVLDRVDGLEVNEWVRIYGTGENRIDGRHEIGGITTATKTVTLPVGGANITEFTPANASLVELTTWVDDETVALFLGIDLDTASTSDADYLSLCVEAANEWAYRRREAYGYTDKRTIIPSPAVKQGTMLYAGALFREKGSVDSFQSFQEMTVAPVGGMGQILRLIGLQRPVVA